MHKKHAKTVQYFDRQKSKFLLTAKKACVIMMMQGNQASPKTGQKNFLKKFEKVLDKPGQV